MRVVTYPAQGFATAPECAVTDIELLPDGQFRASVEPSSGAEQIVAKNVLLATGVCDIDGAGD